MPAEKKVTLAASYTDADEKTHKADATVSLPRHEANRLLDAGLARLPGQGKPAKSDRVADVLSEVGENPELAAAALEAEKAGKNRPSLIEKLEAIINTEEQ